MKKEEYDMLVDGKPVKQVVRRSQDGKPIDVMFRIKKGSSGFSPHIVTSNPEQSHIDIFKDGNKIDTNRTAKPQRAGILLDLSTGISIDLPPIVVDKVSNVPKTPEEILREGREYIKKVKWLRKPNLGKD